MGAVKGARRRLYTPADVAQLKELLAKRTHPREIAELMGRTISSIENKRMLIGRDERAVRLEDACRKRPDFTPTDAPPFRENDDTGHIAKVFTLRPHGFPVAFSRAHFRGRTA